jgi:hypothetical protein
MTVTQTSLQSYDQLQRSGKLSVLEDRVTAAMQEVEDWGETYEPRTRREIADRLGIQASTISGVVNRLIKTGAIEEIGTTICNITGRRVSRIALVRDPEIGEKDDGNIFRVEGTAYVSVPATAHLSCAGCACDTRNFQGTDDQAYQLGRHCVGLPPCGSSEQNPHGIIFLRKE